MASFLLKCGRRQPSIWKPRTSQVTILPARPACAATTPGRSKPCTKSPTVLFGTVLPRPRTRADPTISSSAAAHYFRKAAGDKAHALILENHDDFGGHAKRNEFRAGGRTILGFGGTYSIESPAPYSAVAKALIEELGIDVPTYHKYVSKDLYRSLGLKPRIFFDKE